MMHWDFWSFLNWDFISELRSGNATPFLAILGALTGTFNLGWTVCKDLSNRGRLRLMCQTGYIRAIGPSKDGLTKDIKLVFVSHKASTKPTQPECIAFHVTNTGKQPIRVEQIYARLKDGKHNVHIARELPKVLQPGDVITEHTSDLSDWAKVSNISYFIACDSTGKEWKASKKFNRELIERLDTVAGRKRSWFEQFLRYLC